MRNKVALTGAIAFSLCLAVPASAAKAQDSVADFYKGKTLNIVVGHFVGTGFDLYSRLLIRFMGKHIPGNPDMTVRNMTGASGVTAANYLFNTAPKDGTTMGIFVYTVPLEKLFGNEQALFDPGKMLWIGNMEKASALCGVSKASGIKTFEELRNANREIIFGGTGATGPLVTNVNAVKNLLGARVKVIPGYNGVPAVKQAMLSGEVEGACAIYWSVATSTWKAELDSGTFIPVLQYSGDRLKQLPNITHIDDLSKTEEDRQVFHLAFKVAEMARNYAMPPGVPMERVTAVRKAFMDTMRDPVFMEEAKKMQIEPSSASGEEVEKAWESAAATPAPVVEKVKRALSAR